MKKYLVFLAGMAAQEIEADQITETVEWITFTSGGATEVASFKREQVVGWRVTA